MRGGVWAPIRPGWAPTSHAARPGQNRGRVESGVCVCVCVQSVSCVWLFVAPWIIAYQAALSTEFSRQEYWSEFLIPSPGIFRTRGSNLPLLCLQH